MRDARSAFYANGWAELAVKASDAEGAEDGRQTAGRRERPDQRQQKRFHRPLPVHGYTMET